MARKRGGGHRAPRPSIRAGRDARLTWRVTALIAGHSGVSLRVAHLFTLPSRPASASTFPAGTLSTGCSAAPIIMNKATSCLPLPIPPTVSPPPCPLSWPGRRQVRYGEGSPWLGRSGSGSASTPLRVSSGADQMPSPTGEACRHAPGLSGWYFGPRTWGKMGGGGRRNGQPRG